MTADTDIRGACRGSEALSHGIRVAVTPAYEGLQPFPDMPRHTFSYRVRISNESDRRVQLMRRRWLIIDGDGEANTVEGEGVVGEQPVIEPGESYEYGSWCPLEVHWGTMEGAFEMLADPGDTISVAVGRFFLVADPVPSRSEML